MTENPDITVIVPAHNAEASIGAALDSTLRAFGDHLRGEVIVVDDGSTDATAELVARAAADDERIILLRQKASGWAGAPRNRGLDAARGRYVFFQDADDGLAPGALEEIVSFADAHDSDIVMPRMGSRRRRVLDDVFEATLVDAPLRLLVRNNYVFKLFRRDLLDRLGLRFDEEPIRLEDALFVFTAYAAAGRVSILADRQYYELDAFDTGVHISGRRLDPASHSRSVARCLDALQRWSGDSGDREAALADFLRRVTLTRYGKGFAERSKRNRLAWVAANAPVVREYLTDDIVRRQYGEMDRARYWALRRGDAVAVTQVARRGGRSAFAFATVVRLTRWGGCRIEVVPALGSRSLQDIGLEFASGSRRLRSRAAYAVLGEDVLLGTETLIVRGRLPLRAVLGGRRGSLFVTATNQDGRTVRSRVSLGGDADPVTGMWSVSVFGGLDARGVVSRLRAAARRRSPDRS